MRFRCLKPRSIEGQRPLWVTEWTWSPCRFAAFVFCQVDVWPCPYCKMALPKGGSPSLQRLSKRARLQKCKPASVLDASKLSRKKFSMNWVKRTNKNGKLAKTWARKHENALQLYRDHGHDPVAVQDRNLSQLPMASSEYPAKNRHRACSGKFDWNGKIQSIRPRASWWSKIVQLGKLDWLASELGMNLKEKQAIAKAVRAWRAKQKQAKE